MRREAEVRRRDLPVYIMRLFNPVLVCLLLAVASCSIPLYAGSADAVIDKIGRSLPAREAGWTLTEADGPHASGDGTREMNFTWIRSSETVSALILVFRTVKAAKLQFRDTVGEDGVHMQGFMINGIGDEAYLFPPIIRDRPGSFNLSLRKGRSVIWMTAESKQTILRSAAYVADVSY